MKIVRFQRHLPLTIQFYISCRITGVPPLQSDFYGLSSALKDDTNEPKKRKETRTKPTKMARKKSTLRMTRTTTDTLHAFVLRSRLAPTSAKSRPRAIKRGGGGECLPGTGSPLRIFALARWMQHEITPYHLRISAEGFSPKASARQYANCLIKPTVFSAK